ncbi:MAG: hypothetical protein NTX53_20840 [candidate division WOR-3 bacterium]|nr:hypothetical protein [candidate division WOR-3 bacterium]
MKARFVVMALAVTFCAAVLSPAFGYGADVRERMIVRNLAPPQLDDSVRPVVARDVFAGAGVFGYTEGPLGYGWPLIAAGTDSLPYNVAMLDTSGCLLSRARIPTWGNWDSVFDVAGSGNQPMGETHNIASSKDSNKVCITWVRTDTSPMPGYYRLSNDAGATWGPIQELPRPQAYLADTLTSFHVSSLYPFYDSSNRLHVMAAVHPVVHDTAFIMPAEIWHWGPNNTPQWSRVCRAGCAPEHLGAPVGYNALYACRPSASDVGGHYYLNMVAVWEQFDSSDVDPATNLLRAGVYCSRGDENGEFWGSPYCVAQAGGHSQRFPSVASMGDDTTLFMYEVDLVAGFHVLGQGSATNNPIVVLKTWLSMNGPEPVSLDTLGGTTYDLQTCGPAHSMLVNAPGHGVHALWSYSSDTSRSFPDLNVRYNFYDFGMRCWNWTDPDFMQSGVNVFPYRAGAGCLAAEPATGAAVISACAPPLLPHVAVEERPDPQAAGLRFAGTIVRNVLFMPEATDHKPQAASSLLDIGGRKVLDLKSGANDVRALAPGVYFVREEPQAVSSRPQAVLKVVVMR